MPHYPHLRLIRPAGQVELETPARLRLRTMFGVDSLPAELSEDEAAALASAGMPAARTRFNTLYCTMPAGVDPIAWKAARPWCRVEDITTVPAPMPPGPPAPPAPPPMAPLVPGYAAGRPAPTEHYPTWDGKPYVIGDEKFFLFSLPPDDYYRLVDKFAQFGPTAFHQAVRTEASRRGMVDPLAGVVDLEVKINSQQAAWRPIVGQPTQTPSTSQPRRIWPWVAAGVALAGGVAWWYSRKPTRSNPTNLDVANTILAQMGGAGRLKAMVGAKDFVGDENSLRFKHMPAPKSHTSLVRVILDPSDAYTMEFWGRPYHGGVPGRRRRGIALPEMKESVSGLYAEDLVRTFESVTGLAARL